MTDAINACFEAIAAVIVWSNFARLRTDREVRGILWPTVAFTAVWGGWSIYYYVTLEHWFSMLAASMVCAGNAAWVCLAARLSMRNS